MEPKKYNLYMSTKNQEANEEEIRDVLEKYIRGDLMSTDMQINMIQTGADIIVGTFTADIAESKGAIINNYCISNNINIYCWTAKIT